jgi:pyruvate dehydrogenase E1 component
VAYDPAFAYELAVIIHDGMRRMYEAQERVFYYITVMNENYVQPALPEGAEEGILRGMYRLRSGAPQKRHVQLLGSGTILREVLAAAEMLEKDFQVSSDVWSVTSFSELRRDGIDCERWNMLHPADAPRQSFVAGSLATEVGPCIAATDYMRIVAEQIRPWFLVAMWCSVPTVGRSDCRAALREFFEVDSRYVVIAALKALADEGSIDAAVVVKAIATLGIDPAKPNPVTV